MAGQADVILVWLAFFCLFMANVRVAAQPAHPATVRLALEKAGNNRASLENLLTCYRDADEKEKYHAACFLIANMPYYEQAGQVTGGMGHIDGITQHIDSLYYSLVKGRSAEEQETDPLHATIKESARQTSEEVAGLGLEEPEVSVEDLSDIETLDSAFLARHIENAFSLRARIPLLKAMSLEDFCEYVLPYRAFGDYPLVANGADIAEVFQKYINPEREDSVNALGASYNRVLWWLRHHGGKYPFESMIGFQEVFFNGFHDCVDVTNYATQIYRACGVPAASEFNIAYKIWEGRHYTTAILWRDGKWYSHSPESELPKNKKGFPGCLNLYREHFSLRQGTPFTLHAAKELVPDVFRLPGLEDISRRYLRVGMLTLPVPYSVCQDHNLVYLASFQKSAGLVPVTWGVIDHRSQSATFENVVDSHIYFPVYTDSIGRLHPFSEPFAFFNHQLEELPKPTGKTIKARLYRKYPRKPHLLRLAEEMVGAVVLGSDNAKFEQADTLAVLSFVPDARWESLSLSQGKSRAYKYYRVQTPKAFPHMRLAEIQFLTARSRGYSNVTDTIEYGRTDSFFVRLLDEPLSKCKWKAEYDLNVQTAPEAYPNVTLRLQTPQVVDEVRFVVKHADNGVKDGHSYVLYVWSDEGWKFVEKMDARADYVEPQVPLEVGRVYWLSDINEGKEELPFCINGQGEQVQIYYRVLEEIDKERSGK